MDFLEELLATIKASLVEAYLEEVARPLQGSDCRANQLALELVPNRIRSVAA